MKLVSLKALPKTFDDRIDVIRCQLQQDSQLRLLTFEDDYQFFQRLSYFGISLTQGLNMFADIQFGDSPVPDNQQFQIDHREITPMPRLHKIELLMADQKIGEASSFMTDDKSGQVDLYDDTGVIWARDFFDSYGRFSSRQMFDQAGVMFNQAYYGADGQTVLERQITPSGDRYHIMPTDRFSDHQFASITELATWWLTQRGDRDNVVFNHDSQLDDFWPSVQPQFNVVSVVHAMDATVQRLTELKKWSSVMSVNRRLAATYSLDLLSIKQGGCQSVATTHNNWLTTIGYWVTDADVARLHDEVLTILDCRSDLIIHLFGAFSPNAWATFTKRLATSNLGDRVIWHFNCSMAQRRQLVSQCALSWWFPENAQSQMIPGFLNQCGVPVITTASGFAGARVKSYAMTILRKAVSMGLCQLSDWRNNVKNLS